MKLCKIYVGHKGDIVVEEATQYQETEKLIKYAVFVDNRYGDSYIAKQIRKDNLLKVDSSWSPGMYSDAYSGCIYCFEADLEQAKTNLVSVINTRILKKMQRCKQEFESINEHTRDIPGVMQIKFTVEGVEKC